MFREIRRTPLVGGKGTGFYEERLVLINTARASLVDEEALIEALAEHRIYGYGTDVFKGEPGISMRIETLIMWCIIKSAYYAVSVEAINLMTNTAVDHILEYFRC